MFKDYFFQINNYAEVYGSFIGPLTGGLGIYYDTDLLNNYNIDNNLENYLLYNDFYFIYSSRLDIMSASNLNIYLTNRRRQAYIVQNYRVYMDDSFGLKMFQAHTEKYLAFHEKHKHFDFSLEGQLVKKTFLSHRAYVGHHRYY
jgi:hypothetical protein